jgi:hypothetical protein
MYHIELFNENNEEIRNIINNVKKFLIWYNNLNKGMNWDGFKL